MPTRTSPHDQAQRTAPAVRWYGIMVMSEGRDMATAEPQHEIVKTLKGVTLTMSAQEAASLMHLLHCGVGGTAIGHRGDLGKILVALKAAFGKDAYDGITGLIVQYSGITVAENRDLGYVIAEIKS